MHRDSLRKSLCFYMILDLQCEVDESYTLLGYYTASSGNSLLTVRDNLSVPSSFWDG